MLHVSTEHLMLQFFYCFGGDIIPAEECLSLLPLRNSKSQSGSPLMLTRHHCALHCMNYKNPAREEVRGFQPDINLLSGWRLISCFSLCSWCFCFEQNIVCCCNAKNVMAQRWIHLTNIWIGFTWYKFFFFFFGLNKNISSRFDLNCRLDFACSSCACGFSPVLGASSAVQRHIRLTGNSWVVC